MGFDFENARLSLHRLNNKIAQILVYAELIQLNLSNERDKERIKVVISGALESAEITNKLMKEMSEGEVPFEP
jgi:hypothetical protein